ncbi:Lcl domain-containing protein [Nitrogeniibacter aestuarii]|uniref:Lcl domain-containing protein n=1 Tax=Nitrogeniibacter aestuarii TaxID=2815343 RepID=UPI001E4CAE20|nr:DUF1566 domain-containing protein [Nitrogeniibacter aestuarii]
MIDSVIEVLSDPGKSVPIVIGAAVSWWLAHRYSFAPRTPKLRHARKHKRTDFGCSFSRREAAAVETIETPVGRFRINGDGTMTDLTRGLMWIQAPWGMAWDGREFAGTPIRINWWHATELFGRGESIAVASAGLSRAQLAVAATKAPARGSCTIEFAGHDDWRLPSVGELDAIGLYDPASDDAGFVDPWREGASLLRARLFPNLQRLSYDFALWSANEQGPATAWAMERSATIGDHAKKTEKCVLVVRGVRPEGV